MPIGITQKKTGPLRVRFQFVGAGPTITFQRGTADGLTIAIWEDGQPSDASESQYGDAVLLAQHKGSHASHAGVAIYDELVSLMACFN